MTIQGQIVDLHTLRQHPSAAVRRCHLLAVLTVTVALLSACTARRPNVVGAKSAPLAPCPSSPNCVCSDATDGHFVEPYRLAIDPLHAWISLMQVLTALPRKQVMLLRGDYVHIECRSRLFGFVDDLEFQLRPAENIISVRSASRSGYYDLGANRRRVEHIRDLLRARGTVR